METTFSGSRPPTGNHLSPVLQRFFRLPFPHSPAQNRLKPFPYTRMATFPSPTAFCTKRRSPCGKRRSGNHHLCPMWGVSGSGGVFHAMPFGASHLSRVGAGSRKTKAMPGKCQPKSPQRPIPHRPSASSFFFTTTTPMNTVREKASEPKSYPCPSASIRGSSSPIR